MLPAQNGKRQNADSATPETLRLFVAIQLPEDVRAALRTMQAELRSMLPSGSIAWTRPENMHLTLRFLGRVDATCVPELTGKLRAALAGFGPLDLACERLGCFPDLCFPRVVWAWVHDERERLTELHRQVAAAVAEFAETPAEARFTGHVTLARPKQIRRSDAQRLAHLVEGAISRKFGHWRSDRLELIRSELAPGGSHYTTLDVFPL